MFYPFRKGISCKTGTLAEKGRELESSAREFPACKDKASVSIDISRHS